jgi:hypothetical protein
MVKRLEDYSNRPFAQQLRRLCADKGLTTAKVAARANRRGVRLGKTTLDDLYSGRTWAPNDTTLANLVKLMMLTETETSALERAARDAAALRDEARTGGVADRSNSEAIREGLEFEYQVRRAASGYFDIRAQPPGASFDFGISSSHGSAAVEVKLLMTDRLVSRFLHLSTHMEEECLLIVCREISDTFRQTWKHVQAPSAACLIVALYEPMLFQRLDSYFRGRVGVLSTGPEVYATVPAADSPPEPSPES